MKTVDIEFLMRDKLTPGMERASSLTQKLSEGAEASADEISKTIAETKQMAAAAKEEINRLQGMLDKVADGKPRESLQAQIDALTKVIQEESEAVEVLEKEHTKAEKSTKRLSAQLREMQQEMVMMERAGKANTEEYRALAQQAGELTDALGDVRQQVRHLADDNANLTAMADGINGLTGAFTAGTGVMSLFVSENEDLMKVQAKLQSVMAITMGMQQVFNTLNKDSAFRVIAVARAKAFLTSANTRLATALGISTAAATALMAALTLGLSVAITAAIALWNRYSQAQEEAAAKVKERIELEHDARLTAAKARIELQQQISSLKEFNGSKAEEKKKVEELNKKYGESFGIHKTTRDWYDTLIERGQAYIRVLFLQAKMQALANKAAENQVKIEELEKENPQSGETSNNMFVSGLKATAGFIKGLWNGQGVRNALLSGAANVVGANIKAHQDAISELKEMGKEYEEQMTDTLNEINDLNKKFLSHTITPTATSNNDLAAQLKEYATAHQAIMDKIKANAAALIAEEYERRRAVAKVEHEKELSDIEKQGKEREQLYRAIQKQRGKAADAAEIERIHGQTAMLQGQATQMYAATIAAINSEEAKEKAERESEAQKQYDDLLNKYQDYAARRLALQKQHLQDVAKLEEGRTQENSAEVDAAIAQAAKVLKSQLRAIDYEEVEELQRNSTLMAQLFSDMASKSVDEVQRIIRSVELLHEYMAATKDEKGTATTSTGLTIEKNQIINLGFSEQQLELLSRSPEKLKAIGEALDKLKEKARDTAPFSTFTNAFQKAFEHFKKDGAKGASGGLAAISTAFKDFAPTLGKFGQDLDSILGTSGIGEKVERITGALGGAAETGSGVARVMSGDIVGGAMAAVSGISKIVTSLDGLFGANYDKYNAAKAEYESYLLVLDGVIDRQREMVRTLDAVNAANSYNYAKSLVQGAEEAARQLGRDRLNSGASAGSHSIGVRMSKWMTPEAWAQASAALGADFNKATGGRMTGLFDLSVAQLEKLRDTAPVFWAKLDGDVRKYLEDIIQTGEKSEELKKALTENLTQTSFDSLYDNFLSTLSDMDKDSADFAQDFEEYMKKAMLNSLLSDKYKERLRQWQANFSKANEDGTISDSELSKLRQEWTQMTTDAMNDRELIARTIGQSIGGAQQGKTGGGFTAMSQSQGTKLEGLFTAGQMHWASIDKTLATMRNDVVDLNAHLVSIKEDTIYLRWLKPMYEHIDRIARDGLKMK